MRKLWERVTKKRLFLWSNKTGFYTKTTPRCTMFCERVLSGQMHYCPRASTVLTRSYTMRLLPIPKVKNALKGTYLQSVEEVKTKMADLLKKMTLNGLLHYFEQTCMERCIDREREYFEGD
ncbi:hypothetical protein TNCV_5095891 [Trichonephila clavipes]|nr:hypothetical protein TNCV_5095891 [Trichonephila clavipes]